MFAGDAAWRDLRLDPTSYEIPENQSEIIVSTRRLSA